MLKLFAVSVFGLNEDHVYGSNEDKSRKTHIKWKSMCALLPPKHVAEIKKGGKYTEFMTVREFLQFFGTDVCRKLYGDCWVNSCLNRVKLECSDLAVIQDCRFENEVHAARAIRSDEWDVKVVRLLRAPLRDIHKSETGLDRMQDTTFDLIIPADVTIQEKNQLILNKMYEWGWFVHHIEI